MHYRTLALATAAAFAGPATAATLVDDGVVVAATTSGWLNGSGTAPIGNAAMVTSRGYFGFVLAADNLYNRAVFHGDDAGLVSESRILLTYRLYDLDEIPATLAAPGTVVDAGSPAATAAAALYNDAGSGTVYGTVTIVIPATSPPAPTPAAGDPPAGDPPAAPLPVSPPREVVITLNDAGIAAANAAAAASRPFLVGVSLSVSTAPEPATWALLLTGFGLVGARRRYLRPSTAARTASTDGRTL